jgi:hypothetical protein
LKFERAINALQTSNLKVPTQKGPLSINAIFGDNPHKNSKNQMGNLKVLQDFFDNYNKNGFQIGFRWQDILLIAVALGAVTILGNALSFAIKKQFFAQ